MLNFVKALPSPNLRCTFSFRVEKNSHLACIWLVIISSGVDYACVEYFFFETEPAGELPVVLKRRGKN